MLSFMYYMVIFMRKRSETGKFTAQSDERREVRSLRLTDSTWRVLGDVAKEQGITRADLIEKIVSEGLLTAQSEESADAQEDESETIAKIKEVLLEALKIKNMTAHHRKLMSKAVMLIERLM